MNMSEELYVKMSFDDAIAISGSPDSQTGGGDAVNRYADMVVGSVS